MSAPSTPTTTVIEPSWKTISRHSKKSSNRRSDESVFAWVIGQCCRFSIHIVYGIPVLFGFSWWVEIGGV
jgi:hypothetical protein